ncbi:MAG: RluA family pseudouridine synthase [Phycisphaerales bacterium]|nr:RluA family pseudouridine synthase [Phycisphaerales bacterium]
MPSHPPPNPVGRPVSVVRLDPLRRWVVIDKPTGMLSVPGKGADKQDCAAARVRAAFPHSSGPLVVHRLDMDTSGLLVFGLDSAAQRDLSAQFESRRVFKAYTALVAGVPAAESGQIEVPMRLDIDRRPLQVVDHVHGRPALTRWRVLSIETDRARLRLEPLTGRTHQLRVHLANIGHPILGDVLYGPQPATSRLSERLMLHASELEFADPCTGERVRVASAAPF